ncbi:MAG: hypothetical protein FWD35_00765 [Oscillospiraceae bacterium]|nr:hypothetical protein [Oscillospiraceae bacterium]
MKQRRFKRLMSMVLTFALFCGMIGEMRTEVGAATTFNFNPQWVLAAGNGTHFNLRSFTAGDAVSFNIEEVAIIAILMAFATQPQVYGHSQVAAQPLTVAHCTINRTFD